MKPCAMRVADINDIMESSDDTVLSTFYLKTRFQPLKGMKLYAMRVADINDIIESSDDTVLSTF